MNFSIILWAVAAFMVVTLVLVALLLFAKAKLTSSGSVKIDINEGGKVLEVESGSTLLNTLSEQGIFLPSACGGKGACGQCTYSRREQQVFRFSEAYPQQHSRRL